MIVSCVFARSLQPASRCACRIVTAPRVRAPTGSDALTAAGVRCFVELQPAYRSGASPASQGYGSGRLTTTFSAVPHAGGSCPALAPHRAIAEHYPGALAIVTDEK